ncbi:MAG: rod shape-determining protein [Clostridia bacterium]|nr:rod shape-determining protein [Clostridia bacterium]
MGTSTLRVVTSGFSLLPTKTNAGKYSFNRAKTYLDEPFVAAFDSCDGRLVAFGKKAEALSGRETAAYDVRRPMKNGSIDDVKTVGTILNSIVSRICRGDLYKPLIAIAVSPGLNTIEKRAFAEACLDAGASRVRLYPSPLLSLYGAGQSAYGTGAKFIIDLGAGKTDAAVIAENEIKNCITVRKGADDYADEIRRYLELEKDVSVGLNTARYILHTVGCAVMRREELAISCAGRQSSTGLPVRFEINSSEAYWVCRSITDEIAAAAASMLENTDPELLYNSSREGIILTGGLSGLYGLCGYLKEKLKTDSVIAEDPANAVERGLRHVLLMTGTFNAADCVEIGEA